MPDLELSIPYDHPMLKLGRLLTLLAFPFWGVFAPFLILLSILQSFVLLPAMFLFASKWTNNLGLDFLLYPIVGVVLNAGVIYLGIRTVIVLGDKTISLNEKGISFPANFLPVLRFKRQRSWNDLGKIEVENPERLRFKFLSGGSACINLKRLKPTDKEQLLLGLNVWAKSIESKNEITGLLENLQDQEVRSDASLSYTKLWEEQMNRHFASTAFVPLAQGTLLQGGRIKVIGPIAFGGLSAVYLAQLKSTETVVLKELVTDDVSDSEMLSKSLEMFQREANILMRLSDPRIAHVLDHFTENNRHYLLLEYIQGENLRNIVKQSGVRDEDQAINWAAQIADILVYIHGQDPPIIHRDLTPDNLVLRDGRQIVLIDFGAANTFLGTATGTLVGKQSYISPEQFRGKPVTQSDIYALGATLYFLLTGEDPEPLSQSNPKRLREEITNELDALVANCTAFDPTKRPATALALRDELKQLFRSEKELKEGEAN